MISIVIPTCNRNDFLSNCLDLIFSENPTVSNIYEVIVTDDSQDNIARELLQELYPFAKWVEGPKRGPAANRNNGAKMATGEWLIFLDDDCLPQKNWLSSYIDAIKASKDDLVFEGCTAAERKRQRYDEEAPLNMHGNNLWSCNFAINKEFFEQLKGFDENFPFAAMEDIDFHKRVSDETHVVFLPQAMVIHPWRRIMPFKNFKKHFRSHQYFAKKHGLLNDFSFRFSRVKIFVGGMFTGFRLLLHYSFKGWPIYIEKCALNFCLIFIT
jgi:GT2 family glycosyltransferase